MTSRQAIYDQHAKAFSAVSAYVVLGPVEPLRGYEPRLVARIAFKFGKGGRVTCYAHMLGIPMERGHADGGGYDKCSAAAESAFRKMVPPVGEDYAHDASTVAALKAAMAGDDGKHWDNRLRDAGFTVLQAV